MRVKTMSPTCSDLASRATGSVASAGAGRAVAGAWDPGGVEPGDYIIRVIARDFSGNEAIAGRDVAVTVTRMTN